MLVGHLDPDDLWSEPAYLDAARLAVEHSAAQQGLKSTGEMADIAIIGLTSQNVFPNHIRDDAIDAIADAVDQDMDTSLLYTLAADDGMLIGCYAAEEHTDEDVSVFAHRWVVVMQACPGAVFRGATALGVFELPLEAGQIIAFDETLPHSVMISSPDHLDITSPNLFYTIPDPTQSRDMAKTVGLLGDLVA